MTRKKFKKLLMAEGVPRNMANEMAATACANSVPLRYKRRSNRSMEQEG